MNRPLRLLCLVVAVLLGGTLVPVALWGGAPPASAAVAVAHGQGVTWAADPSAWMGDYVLDDGERAFCLDVAKRPPTGSGIEYGSGELSGLFAVDDAARLRYISERWGASPDPLAAAAAQLAVWSITGLDGHDQAHFAKRANGDADAVLAAANHILALANGPGGASRGATASVTVAVDGDRGTVRSELLVDYLSGAAQLPPEQAEARFVLHGARFPDGSRTATHGNGLDLAILPDQHGAIARVTVDVEYPELPFGIDFRLGHNVDGGQDLLITSPRPISAAATASVRVPSGLPFRPRVQTVTSAAIAQPGVELSDRLHLDVHPGSATEGEWGVYRVDERTLAPIPVVIESVLWGPFPRLPVETAAVPAGAPRVCSVELLVTTGPGDLVSRPCRIHEPGYYVWTDSIDPARTPPAQGGARVQPWQSAFGVAAETSLVPAPPPTVSTVASPSTLDRPGCVRDRLSVTGLPPGVPRVPVHVRLLGPLASLPAFESEPDGWHEFPVAASATVTVTADGTVDTPCLPVDLPGHYYFVFDSPGTGVEGPAPTTTPKIASADDGGGGGSLGGGAPSSGSAATTALVPPFHDHRVHAIESIALLPPPTVPPTATATPHPAVPSAPPPPGVAQLPVTGTDARGTALGTAGSVLAIIAGLAIVGTVFARPFRRGRRR